MILTKNKDNFLLILLAFLLWLCVAYRAFSIGLTHDESASYIYLNDQNILGYLWDKNAWPNANNHYINTLSFQLLTRLLGTSEFVIRIFSVLSYGIAAFYFIKITQRFSNFYIKVAAFAFVFLNPYFMDFFSLARGYGSANAFTIMGIYYALRYTDRQQNRNLLVLTLSIVLASLSLFSSVILFPVLFGAILLYFILQGKDDFIKESLSIASKMVILGIVSLIPLFTPLVALSKNDEFKWGARSLIECFQSLVNHSSYSQKYMLNDLFLAGFFICLLVIAYYFFWTRYKKDQLFFIVFVGFFIMIVVMILAKESFNSFYPVERKTTMFVPWLSLIFFSLLDKMSAPRGKYLGISISILFLFHYAKSFDTSYVREWWFDRDTKLFISKIEEDMKSSGVSGQASIQGHWMFWPSLTFYNKTKYPNLKVSEYKKELDVANLYDYFVSFDSDTPILQDKYVVMYKADTGISLYRKKK